MRQFPAAGTKYAVRIVDQLQHDLMELLGIIRVQ
jgi:hypothetical protein